MALRGRVDDAGTLIWDDRAKVKAAIAALTGHRVEVTLRKRGEKRSGKSNRFWWGGILKQLADEFGYSDPDELHDALAHKFRPLPPCPITGAPRRMRTSEMTQEQFSAFVRDVVLWAEADMGVRLEGVDL